MSHGLEHLQDQADASAEVLVIDFDNLTCVKAVVSNVSQWGCRLTSDEIYEIRKNIGIRLNENSKLVKATVTAVKGQDASVVFPKQEAKIQDKRRERRNKVSIPVKISDREGITEISGTVTDAGQNGCRVNAKGLSSLPEEVTLNMRSFDKPVLGEFVWRNETSAGVRLIWDQPDAIG
jgi:hypothetical protein